MWDKIKGWMRSHWKTVAAISLAIAAAIVIGAVCANPVGAPIVAAVASIKIFSFLASMSPVWVPFVMAGLAAATTLTAAFLFNAATWVANWLDKKIDKKDPVAGKGEPHYQPVGESRSCRAMASMGGSGPAGRPGYDVESGHAYHPLPSKPANQHGHLSRLPSQPSDSFQSQPGL